MATARVSIESSRQRIHAAALHLFGRFGFEAVSLQMIADAVGLHKSTLFHHYPTKLAIALEVFEEALTRVVQELSPLASNPPRIDDLRACMDTLTDWLCAEPDTARLLMSFITAPQDSELLSALSSRASDLERQLFGLLGSWLERARRAGIIRQLSVRQAMVNAIGLMLFYPAVAEHLGGGEVAGSQCFAPKAVRIRKQELWMIFSSMLDPAAGSAEPASP